MLNFLVIHRNRSGIYVAGPRICQSFLIYFRVHERWEFSLVAHLFLWFSVNPGCRSLLISLFMFLCCFLFTTRSINVYFRLYKKPGSKLSKVSLVLCLCLCWYLTCLKRLFFWFEVRHLATCSNIIGWYFQDDCLHLNCRTWIGLWGPWWGSVFTLNRPSSS